MESYFEESIGSWKDWSRVYQSIPAFTPLAEGIFRREHLSFPGLSPLTPGTNAVFRAGDFVIKIFFPSESGLNPEPDYKNEAAVCGHLTALSLPTPRLLAKGMIQDKYKFYYIITQYSQGREAGDYLATASVEEKIAFAKRLFRILEMLNHPADGLIEPVDLKKRAIENFRLKDLPLSLQDDYRRRASALELPSPVLVHGDLTGENLLVREDGSLEIIDCADACLAPAWYELGPVILELFRLDPVLINAFRTGEREEFVELLLNSLCLHDFGAGLLLEAVRREGRGIEEFPTLLEVKKFFLERI